MEISDLEVTRTKRAVCFDPTGRCRRAVRDACLMYSVVPEAEIKPQPWTAD
jgi:hypothetical protein